MQSLTEEREELWKQTRHLSFSRINRYLQCPEQYRLYYIENLRPRIASASLVFGQIVHQALALLFRDHGDPMKLFVETWREAQGFDLNYSQWESWEKLNAGGQTLLERFLREELSRLGKQGLRKSL
jgi:PD-(D/E)XK nuclease superfamily protein